MSTVRDLRDLVNVSRLTYRDSDDEDYNDNRTNSNNHYKEYIYGKSSALKYSFKTSHENTDGLSRSSSIVNSRNGSGASQGHVNTNLGTFMRLTKSNTMEPVTISLAHNSSYLANKQRMERLTNSKTNIMSPTLSQTTPNRAKPQANVYVLNSVLNSNSSSDIYRDRDLLLERNSIPNLSFTNLKKPLPPLNHNKPTTPSDEYAQKQEPVVDHRKIKLKIENKNDELIVKDLDDENYQNVKITSNKEVVIENNIDKNVNPAIQNGNFDYILTYVDASVVGDWLNRANRSLKKMNKWHQDNSTLYSDKQSQASSKNPIKYESFVLFANFWLGFNENAKFTDKQRRQLIEMEFSIINDEVMQAFQVGLESQQISINEINQLLRAVFKEYPLQLLSFRGAYLLLDYVDILSSDRQDEYKRLLSDVKCRTVNKQYAQWLLSIRSFALINLCWSIVKFFRKTVQQQIKYVQTAESIVLTPRPADKDSSKLAELDGRLSSLSNLQQNIGNMSLDSSFSSTTSSSSSISSVNSSKSKPKSARTRPVTGNKSRLELNSHISPLTKNDFYLEAVFKYDLPDVLHYLIITKKCDPYKKDEHDRTLIFLAVMNEKPKILNYLVRRWPLIDVNLECDSGNTPLHAAVNKGNMNLVEILLQSLEIDLSENADEEYDAIPNSARTSRQRQIDVNKINRKCMDATPLHLAVWNDYNEIALKLIQARADPYMKMNGISTAFDLARDNSNEVLFELLHEYYNSIKDKPKP